MSDPPPTARQRAQEKRWANRASNVVVKKIVDGELVVARVDPPVPRAPYRRSGPQPDLRLCDTCGLMLHPNKFGGPTSSTCRHCWKKQHPP